MLVLERLSVEAMGSILDRAVAALGIRVLEQDKANLKHQDQTDGQKLVLLWGPALLLTGCNPINQNPLAE